MRDWKDDLKSSVFADCGNKSDVELEKADKVLTINSDGCICYVENGDMIDEDDTDLLLLVREMLI